MTIPNEKNFCGGSFQDWLEVNLIKECDGKCSWCVERRGWHPKHKATWTEIAVAAYNTGKKNIMLLGGEPLLYKDIGKLIKGLTKQKRNCYVTTNGSQLTPQYIRKNLLKLKGINISIHHYDLEKNYKITGIRLDYNNLEKCIKIMQTKNIDIRLNCNCIGGYVDTKTKILKYLSFVNSLGIKNVRFAELKFDKENFIDLAKLFNYGYGLNDNPFKYGCYQDAIINGIHVNFRQMCGLQTDKRSKPRNPKQYNKQVLYYDGKIYDGWQLIKENSMTTKELISLLKEVKEGKVSVAVAATVLDKEKTKEKAKTSESGGGCSY